MAKMAKKKETLFALMVIGKLSLMLIADALWETWDKVREVDKKISAWSQKAKASGLRK